MLRRSALMAESKGAWRRRSSILLKGNVQFFPLLSHLFRLAGIDIVVKVGSQIINNHKGLRFLIVETSADTLMEHKIEIVDQSLILVEVRNRFSDIRECLRSLIRWLEQVFTVLS